MTDLYFPRRAFLSTTAAGVAATAVTAVANESPLPATQQRPELPAAGQFPLRVIASENGLAATKKAYDLLREGADTLDAVVAGVALLEADPQDTSVGYGGLPNEEGVVELDAAVMDGPQHRAGAVAALQQIKHPAQVALQVLRCTDHVLLVGDAARRFARALGFPEENLLTERARQVWLHWKLQMSDQDDWLAPATGAADSDTAAFFRTHSVVRTLAGTSRLQFVRPTGTVHCAAMNANGDISCTTTTSGLAFKIAGRVGDSPIIGAGLYVDNEIGSCGSTGRGEANLQNLSSFAAVELMRGGLAPCDAGREICRRIAHHTRRPDLLDDQGRPHFDLKFYLMDKSGRHAGVSLYGPAQYAVTDAEGSRLEDMTFLYEQRDH